MQPNKIEKLETNDICQAAQNSMIELTPKQEQEFLDDFNESLQTLEQMLSQDVCGVEPLIYLGEQQSVLRKDVSQNSQTDELLFKNAPETQEHYFIVPKIIE